MIMLDYLLKQGMLLAFVLVGFLLMFNKLATPQQKEAFKPALKELPRRVKYVLGEFIYLMKNKLGGVSKSEKISDIDNYRRSTKRLRRRKQ